MTTSRRRAIRPQRSISHADGTEVRTYVGKAPFDDSPLGRVKAACEFDEPMDHCECNGCQAARAWAEAGRTPPFVDERPFPGPVAPLGLPTYERLPKREQRLTWPELPETLADTADLIETNGELHGRKTAQLSSSFDQQLSYETSAYRPTRPAKRLDKEAGRVADFMAEGAWQVAWNTATGWPPGRPRADFSYGEHEQVYELTGIGPEVFDHVVKGQRQRGKKRTPEEQQAYDFVAARIAGVRSTKLLCQAYGTGKTTVMRLRRHAASLSQPDLGTETLK